MAGAHGAGLMLVLVVLPICLAAAPAQGRAAGALPIAFGALAVHTGAMLATIAAISVAVYRFIGVDFLRRGWINLDLVWTAALILCGIVLLAA